MKKSFIILLLLVVLILLFLFFMIFKPFKLNTKNFTKGKVVFKYNNINISETLSPNEFDTIKEIFKDKLLYKDDLTCGFNEEISIVLDDNYIFSIACDGCGIIYYVNEKKYFNLSEKENKIIRDILIHHGFSFPCI